MIELTEALKSLEIDLNRVARPAAPTAVANAGAGNPSGTYYYGVSFVTADGETEVSAASSSITVASKQIDLTIPVSADPRVTARNVYRTAHGAADQVLMQYVATVSDNTTTAYTDNLADGDLGDPAPYINDTGRIIVDGATTVGILSEQSLSLGHAAMSQGGYASTAFGSYALGDNTSGYRNTAVGHDALGACTVGNGNVAAGVHALGDGTTVSLSTAIGYSALKKNNSNNSVAVGAYAATEMTAGIAVAVGAQALQLKTNGGNSVAIGYQTLQAAGAGASNVAVGTQAGKAVTSANFSALVGHQAGQAITTGSGNTALGFDALGACTTGQHNVAIGRDAGDGITTGSNNIVLGYNIEPDSPTASDQINIGNRYYHDRLQLGERTSDPADPAEGNFVMWMSDGTGAGDDGDIMIKITAGSVTKTATLVDFSAI